MKKIVIALIILSLFFLVSCSSVNKSDNNTDSTVIEKQYSIKTYSLDMKTRTLLMQAFPEINENNIDNIIKEIVTGRINNELAQKIKEKMEIKSFNAREIINFNESSVRFVDNTGKEIFETADYIEVEQIK